MRPGLETYCLAPRGVPSMDEENLSYSDYVQHAGHVNDPANIALATTVHAALVRNLGLTDRGVKRARFVVVRNITIPGILIEGGFMSGTPDARLIATAEYRQRIAQCILDGVNRYKQAVANQIRVPEALCSRRRNRSHKRAQPGKNGRRRNGHRIVGRPGSGCPRFLCQGKLNDLPASGN